MPDRLRCLAVDLLIGTPRVVSAALSPHDLSPAKWLRRRGNPRAGHGRLKRPQQCSDPARKPVHSEQSSGFVGVVFASIRRARGNRSEGLNPSPSASQSAVFERDLIACENCRVSGGLAPDELAIVRRRERFLRVCPRHYGWFSLLPLAGCGSLAADPPAACQCVAVRPDFSCLHGATESEKETVASVGSSVSGQAECSGGICGIR